MFTKLSSFNQMSGELTSKVVVHFRNILVPITIVSLVPIKLMEGKSSIRKRTTLN